MKLEQQSHVRKNPLNGDWVLVSPQRLDRPWQGQLESNEEDNSPAYDPECYLCPGNERVNGEHNPAYAGAYIFNNDFPALSDQSDFSSRSDRLFEARPETGRCRVVCFSDRHDLRLATMSGEQIVAALGAMFAELSELDGEESIGYVQIFENRGLMMGCSNAHPHAQIWATAETPAEPAKELESQQQYLESNQTVLLADYLAAELREEVRIVCDNEHFVVVVPFWAVWPFETLILPRRNISGPDELQDGELASLADVLRRTLAGYDSLFGVPAPYSMGFHPRPSDGRPHPEWTFHAHVYPPLLRSATVRKHLVGFEMLAMPQRDLTPETAAERLRNCIRAA